MINIGTVNTPYMDSMGNILWAIWTFWMLLNILKQKQGKIKVGEL